MTKYRTWRWVRPLCCAVRSSFADLPRPRPVEIVEQLARGAHSPYLVPITVPIPLLGKTEGRLLRRGLEEQHDVLLQARLVAFDDHHVITAGGNDLLAQCALAVQRIPRDHRALQRQLRQQLRQPMRICPAGPITTAISVAR